MGFNLAQDLSYILQQGTTVSQPQSSYRIGTIKEINSDNSYNVILPKSNKPIKCQGQEGSSYNLGDQVYVLGNGTLIIGKVAVTKSISGFKKPEQEMSKTQKILKIEDDQYNEILDSDIKFKNIRDIGVEPYNAFWIKARFTANIPKEELKNLKSGDYGILVTITSEKGKYYVYRFSSKDNMYSDSLQYNKTRQEAVFSIAGLDSRIKNIRIQGYVDLNSFINYNGTINQNIKKNYFKMANLTFYLGYSINSLKNSPKLILQSNDNKKYYKEESSNNKKLVDYNEHTDLYTNSAVRGMYLSYNYYDSDLDECKVISLTEAQIDNFSNTTNIKINSDNEIRWYRYNPDRKEEQQDKYGGLGWLLLGKKKNKKGKLLKDEDGYYILDIDNHGKKIGRHLRLLNKEKNTKFKVVWISSTDKVVSNVLSFTRGPKPSNSLSRTLLLNAEASKEVSLDIRETSFPPFKNERPDYSRITSYDYQGNYGFYIEDQEINTDILIKLKPNLDQLDNIDKIEWTIPANSMIKLKNSDNEYFDNIYNNSLWEKDNIPMLKSNQYLDNNYYRYSIEEIKNENGNVVEYKFVKYLTKYSLNISQVEKVNDNFEILNFEEDISFMLSINEELFEEQINQITCETFSVSWYSVSNKIFEEKTQIDYGIQVFNFWQSDIFVDNDIEDSIEFKNVKFGTEDEERKFTGVILGVYDQNNATEQVGSIVGYKNDIETFNIDCESGIFTIGPEDGHQIVLNGNTGEILINNQSLLELILGRKEN